MNLNPPRSRRSAGYGSVSFTFSSVLPVPRRPASPAAGTSRPPPRHDTDSSRAPLRPPPEVYRPRPRRGAPDGDARQRRDERGGDGDAGGWPVLRNRARRDVDMNVVPGMEVLRKTPG